MMISNLKSHLPSPALPYWTFPKQEPHDITGSRSDLGNRSYESLTCTIIVYLAWLHVMYWAQSRQFPIQKSPLKSVITHFGENPRKLEIYFPDMYPFQIPAIIVNPNPIKNIPIRIRISQPFHKFLRKSPYFYRAPKHNKKHTIIRKVTSQLAKIKDNTTTTPWYNSTNKLSQQTRKKKSAEEHQKKKKVQQKKRWLSFG